MGNRKEIFFLILLDFSMFHIYYLMSLPQVHKYNYIRYNSKSDVVYAWNLLEISYWLKGAFSHDRWDLHWFGRVFQTLYLILLNNNTCIFIQANTEISRSFTVRFVFCLGATMILWRRYRINDHPSIVTPLWERSVVM